MKTNPLLPLLGLGGLVLLAGVFFIGGNDKNTEVNTETQKEIVTQKTNDNDAVDALKTVSARLSKSNKDSQQFKTRIGDLQRQISDQAAQINKLLEATKSKNTATRPGYLSPASIKPAPASTADSDKELNALDQVRALATPILDKKPFQRLSSDSLSPLESALSGVPVGNTGLNSANPRLRPGQTPGYVRIEPLGGRSNDTSNAGAIARSVTGSITRSAATVSESVKRKLDAEAVTPRYTIPLNSTFIDSVAMTAMIGRVPVNGEVSDTVPFKILVGSNNLAANGHHIPGLTGMVLAGRATGDRTLSCVYGHIDSALFVFTDGRTVSRSGNAGSSTPGSLSQDTSSGELAWLSDEFGNPCVPGTYITNAPQTLLTSVFTGAASAGAQAFSEAQTTTRKDTSGGSSSTVDNPADFLLGRIAAGGVDQVTNYLARQQPDEWDAVYLPAGSRVAVHFSQSMAIDHDPNARRLVYEHTSSFWAGGLD